MMLIVDARAESHAATLLTTLLHATDVQIAEGTGQVPRLVAGSTISSLHAVCDALCVHKRQPEWMGRNEREIKEVNVWLAFFETIVREGLVDAHATQLDRHLLTSTFVAAHQLTVADLAVFAGAYATIAAWTPAQHAQYANVSRWFVNMSHLDFVVAHGHFKVVPTPYVPSSIYATDVSEKVATAASSGSSASASGAGAAAPNGEAKGEAKGDAKKEAKEAKAAAAAAPAAGDATAAAKPKKEAKAAAAAAAPAAAAAGAAAAEGGPAQIYRLDLRVGRVLSVRDHPTDERLYVEEIDVGEDKPRTVVSGLREYVSREAFANTLVVLILNLKASDIKGVESNGRVLVATDAANDKVKEVCVPPAGAQVGEKVTFAGLDGTAPDAVCAPKNLHRIMKDLHTNAERVVQFAQLDFRTSAGVVTVPSIANGTVA